MKEMKEGKMIVKQYKCSNRIIYIGDYLDSKKHGNGKEYFCDFQLFFNGEFLNGKKWNGKICDSNNNVICEIKEGNKSKINIKYCVLIFEGYYLNGKKHGFGKEYCYYTMYLEPRRFTSDVYTTDPFDSDVLFYDLPYQQINKTHLKFEGEHLYDFRRKGKEYNKDGKLVFEG